MQMYHGMSDRPVMHWDNTSDVNDRRDVSPEQTFFAMILTSPLCDPRLKTFAIAPSNYAFKCDRPMPARITSENGGCATYEKPLG
jgi:hypothetical protein